jgi:poly(A) polymerase
MRGDPQYVAALRIVQRLRELGHQAYFAGGCVRDLLLGTAPKDFDVATDATPDAVQAAFACTENVGAHFGVVLVIDKVEGERIATEVATFRHDGAYSDGRRPDAVRFSTDPREDVLRRDFSINGLLLDALRFDSGDRIEDCVLDFVGGRNDLAAKTIRAIGEPELRFAEDKLRMLRAVRFAARLGFQMEARTMQAMQRNAAEIAVVSAERVREELTKILTEGHARRGLELLDESGLLAVLLPEVAKMKGVEQPPQYHPEGDVWVHTLMLLEHLRAPASVPQGLKPRAAGSGYGTAEAVPLTRQPASSEQSASIEQQPGVAPAISPTLAWGMLLHDVGKPATFTPPDPAKPGDRIRFNGHVEVGVAIARTILNRLRFSNDAAEQILALIKHHMQFGDVMQMRQSTLKRFLRMPKFDEHLALHFADASSASGDLSKHAFVTEQLAALGAEAIRPVPLLTGSDLIAAGFKPGPGFREMLLAAEDAQLEGRVTTKEEALRLVREMARSRGEENADFLRE